MRSREAHAEKERFRNQAKRVWVQANGPIPRDDLGRPWQIHHVDRNWRNNSLDNLQCVTRKEHDAIHHEERVLGGITSTHKFTKGNQLGKLNIGKARTTEARAKISAARCGKPMSAETKRKVAASMLGKNKGKKKSVEEVARREASKAAKRIGNPSYGNRWT